MNDSRRGSSLKQMFYYGDRATELIQFTATNGNITYAQSTNLSSISLPKVSIIGDYAFNACTELKDIYLSQRQTPPMASGVNLFNKCKNPVSVHVKSGTIDSYRNSEKWKTMEDSGQITLIEDDK